MCFGPKKLLIKCGAISPIKEIIPLAQTADDVARLLEIKINIFAFLISSPKDFAEFSPPPRISKNVEEANKSKKETIAIGTIKKTSSQVLPLKLPIVHA